MEASASSAADSAAAADGTTPTDDKVAMTAPTAPPTGRMGAMWPFIIISITYLLFTVTDGAVRMLVLLHAYNKGFTAMVRGGGKEDGVHLVHSQLDPVDTSESVPSIRKRRVRSPTSVLFNLPCSKKHKRKDRIACHAQVIN